MDLIILAQVTDDVLAGFLEQIPLSLVVMVCGSGLLLFVAFAWFAYFKPLQNKRREQKALLISQNPPEKAPAPTIPASVVNPITENLDNPLDDEDDLPDLGLLVGEEVVIQEPIIPEPAIIHEPIIPQQVVSEQQTQPQASTEILRLSTGHILNSEPVLNIMRDQRDGRLVVVIDGVGYRSLDGYDDLKKQFIKIMRDLNQVVTQPDDNPPTDEAVTGLSIPVYDNTPGKLPSFKLEDNMTPSKKGSYEVTSVPELNLAEAIEAYLQYKIHNTPAYRARVIHIHPAPSGGVRIQVDNDYYEAVSDIADADVRGFIQEAIQEWQELNR